MTDNTKAVADAAQKLERARKHFETVDREYQDASRTRTVAINDLNQAQKEFASCIDAVKQEQPADSDMGRRPGVPLSRQ